MASQLFSERTQLLRRMKARRRRNVSPVGSSGDVGPKSDFVRVALLNALLERLESERNAVLETEEAMLLEEFGESRGTPADAPSDVDYRRTLIDMYSASEQAPDKITLVQQGDSRKNLKDFVGLYLDVAAKFECQVRVGIFRRPPEPLPAKYEFFNPEWDTVRAEVMTVVEALTAIEESSSMAIGMELSPQIS
jgi:hypothetical protein